MQQQLNFSEYNRLDAFFDGNGYKLGPLVEKYNEGRHDKFHKACVDIDSKKQIIILLRTSSSLLMVPYDSKENILGHAPAYRLSQSMSHGEALFVKTVFFLLF